ncbi:NUDIX hydrolase [Variovorax sp. LG9.2]|uniref:NUDIX hydrolase n=1 Tax=Variovorax sp. LG9.2 TaxID=3048626 RepID=UPI002B22A7EA|nr:NUDIX domain-containing protein [Variovorax sp. LG9.2]MEB0056476.1 NUDIX domain-containing protein [Variovorax sp. LG9.2]
MTTSNTSSQLKRYPMPFTRIEIAAMSLIEGELHVLLARRAEAPYAGRWALPGGVLRIDLDCSLDTAAQRVMQERLGMQMPFLRQLTAVGGPTRDPRAPWALSVVYRAMVPFDSLAPAPGKRIEALAWRAVMEAAADKALAFDHAALVEEAARITRSEVEELRLPFGFLPKHFTLSELQLTCAELLGRPLDKSSFRRKLADRDLLEPVEGAMKTGAFRPAQLYRQKRS